MSSNCNIQKTLLLIFSVCFHVEITVSLLRGVPNVTIPNAEYSGGYGGYVNLECIVDSTPNHTDVYWQKLSNGTVENIISPRINVYGATVTRPSLTFTRLTINDEGEYTCFAVNIAGTGKSNPTYLTVLGGDIIVNSSITSYTEIYGSQVTLQCSVTYETKNEPVHLFWNTFNSSGITATIYENDHVTLNNYSVTIPDKDGFRMNHYFLTITTVSFKDNGWYLCNFRDQVSWGYGQNIELEVIGGVPNVTIPNSEYRGVYGGYITLECIVDSTPNHTDVYWQHIYNGTMSNITSSSPSVVYGATVSEPSLSIHQITFNDDGQYICFAVNIVGTGESTPTSLTVVGGVPIVHVEPRPYSVEYGQDITLVCDITSYPPHFNVYWSRELNGKTRTSHAEGNITYSPDKIALIDVTFEESGQYRCHAENMIGIGQSNPVNLTVYGDVPNVTIPNAEYSRGYGWHMTLECIIDSTPNHTNVYWQHTYNGTIKNITSSSPNVVYGATVSEPSLRIRQITFNDEGQYICFAVNIIGTGESKPTSLTVLGGELLVNSSITKYTEVYGSQVTLRCSVTYKTKFEPLYLSWNKFNDSGFTVPVDPAFDHVTLSNYSVEIPESDGFKMNHYFLTLKPLSFDDDGWYRCGVRDQVSKGYGQAIDLKIIGGVPNVTIPKSNYSSGHGYYLRLECNIESTPNHTDVYWQKLSNGTVINITSSSPDFYDSTISFPTLAISTVSKDDAGQYTCFAVNIVGTGKSQPTTLKVLGGYIFVNSSKQYYAEVYGSQVTLRCSVTFESELGPASVTWYKYSGDGSSEDLTLYGNDHVTLNNNSVAIPEKDGFTMNHYSLTITTLSFKDDGWYFCEATDQFSIGFSHFILLEIIGGIPNVTIPNLNYSIGSGRHLVLECIIASTPNHYDVYWEKLSNGTVTNITSSSPGFHGATDTSPSLNISHVSTTNAGQYTCFAVNIVGTGSSQPTNLTVLGGDIVVNSSKTNYTEVYGSQVTLHCSVTYETKFGPLNVTWFKFNESGISVPVQPPYYGYDHVTLSNHSVTIPEKNGFKMDHFFLEIRSLSFKDDGSYICSATNQFSLGSSPYIDLKIIGDIPYIHLEPGPYNATYGSNITLTCNITSVPTHFNVYWESVANGVTTTWHQEEKHSESLALLDLDNASSSDTGQYICRAENVLGTGKSKPVNVTIYGDQNHPNVNIESNQYVVKYGSSLTITSSVRTTELNPVSDIYWQYNNNGVITKISEETDGINGSTIEIPSLTILNVTSSESGTYTCYAKNDIETGQSRPINVIISGGVPKVFVKKTNYTVGYGENVTMFCNITSDPIATNVYWEKEFNGTTIVINNLTTGIQGISVDAPLMTIVTTTTSDIGNYRCIATNDVGTGCSETTRLEVIGELPSISITTSLPEVKYGDKVHILCVVTGNPPPTQVYWEKEFNDIKKVIHNGTIGTEGITVANPSLILLHATDSDKGLYKCFAVNEFGRDSSSSVELNVVGGRPEVDAPSITHITGIGYTITLTCSIRNAFPAVSKVYWERSIRGTITRLSSVSIGILGVTVDNPSLIIPSAMESMTGEYTCFAVNSVGTGSSFPATLTVKAEVTSENDDQDDEEDNTDTLVNGIIAGVSALAGIGSVVVGYWAYTHSKKPVTQQSEINKSEGIGKGNQVVPEKQPINPTENGSKMKTSSSCKQNV